uniref:Uncharacterized protein n=1 Tax=Panagrellus redivivus TaxID=6233 RepID=A0A7E4VFD5_PANRE
MLLAMSLSQLEMIQKKATKEMKKRLVFLLPPACENDTDIAIITVHEEEAGTKKKNKSIKTEATEAKAITPSAVLTFTMDNRVLIKADRSFRGDMEVLAYVRLSYDKPPQTGTVPYEALGKREGAKFTQTSRVGLMTSDIRGANLRGKHPAAPQSPP